MFSRIGAVILLVSDMKDSIKFYRDILGMEVKEKSKDWTEFSKHGTVLALHPVKKSKKRNIKRSKSMLVGFNVYEIETLCKDLKKKKVRFYKKLSEEPFGKHAIIRDPDGHLISLIEPPAEAPKEGELSQVTYYHGFAPA